MLTESQTQTLTDLQPYFYGCAKKVLGALSLPLSEKDDVVGHMNMVAVERALEEPTFLEQTKAYVGRYVSWSARDHLKSTWFSQYRGRGREEFVLDDEPEENRPMAEALEDPTCPGVDSLEIGLFVRDLIKDLPERSYKLALLLAQGYNKTDSARLLGCSPQALNADVKRVKAALAPALA